MLHGWAWPSALLLLTVSSVANAETSIDLGSGVTLSFHDVAPQSFEQGSPANEVGRGPDEGRRTVRLSGYAIGKSPITVGQWKRFVEATDYATEAEKGDSGGFGWDGSKLVQRKEFTWKNPGFPQTDAHPVVIVTFGDATAFANWVNDLSIYDVALPTEAEWELAARGGTKTRFYWGDGDEGAETKAWYAKNAGAGTRPVGGRGTNPWGLSDVSGNVWEWCSDGYGPIGADAVTDPYVPSGVVWAHSDKPRRVLKGASWQTDDKNKLRPATRYRATDGSRNADFGFRLVAKPKPEGAKPKSTETSSETSPRKKRSSGGDGGCAGLGIVGGIMAALAALVAFAVSKMRSASTSSIATHQNAADGFWIKAPASAAGREIDYVAKAGGRSFQSRVRLTGAPQGVFVFTGQTPSKVTLTDVSAWPGAPTRGGSASPTRGGSVSRLHDDWATHNTHSSGTGWPSAY